MMQGPPYAGGHSPNAVGLNHPMGPPQFSQAMEGIAEPHHNDVLCGRGVTTNRHKGNENFRGFVNRNKALYVSSTKRQKMTISRSIVEAVRNLNPAGRFLEKDQNTGLWFDVGDKKAVEKTSQALRDGAATLRKQLTEDLADPDFIGAVFGAGGDGNNRDNNNGGKDDRKQVKKRAKGQHSGRFSDSLLTPSLEHSPRKESDQHNNMNDNSNSNYCHPPPSVNTFHQSHGHASSMGGPFSKHNNGGYDNNMHTEQDSHSPHNHHWQNQQHPHNSNQHNQHPYMQYNNQGNQGNQGGGNAHPHAHTHNNFHSQHPNQNHNHQHMVSPCPSTSTSPTYSPMHSPPNSPPHHTGSLSNYHNNPTNNNGNNNNNANTNMANSNHPYSTNYSSIPPPHQQQQQQQQQGYWNHLQHQTTPQVSRHQYNSITPEGRPAYGNYGPPSQQHQWNNNTQLSTSSETHHEFVEVTEEGRYEFSEDMPPKPHYDKNCGKSNNNNINKENRKDQTSDQRSDLNEQYKEDPEDIRNTFDMDVDNVNINQEECADRIDSMGMNNERDGNVTPPRRQRADSMDPFAHLFDKEPMAVDSNNDVDTNNAKITDTPPKKHTEFTPPRNVHKNKPMPPLQPPAPEAPVTPGSLGPIDESIWLKESPLLYTGNEDDMSSNKSMNSGDSFFTPLPYRTTKKSDFAPFLGLLCGCAPAYCPQDTTQDSPPPSIKAQKIKDKYKEFGFKP